MAFKTIEEANQYQIDMEEKYKNLETAKQGLETKLSETEKVVQDSTKEIDRLKIKNYEYYEKITVGTQQPSTPNTPNEPQVQEVKLDDILKSI